MTEWQVHITDDWSHIDTANVVIFRHVGDGVEVMQSIEQGSATITTVEPGAALPPALHIPRSALEAIAEKLRPGPSSAEVARLEEALTIERRRVDEVLARRP